MTDRKKIILAAVLFLVTGIVVFVQTRDGRPRPSQDAKSAEMGDHERALVDALTNGQRPPTETPPQPEGVPTRLPRQVPHR